MKKINQIQGRRKQMQYKIKIFGGIEDGKTKGFFREEQIPKAIAMLTLRYGKDWAYDIIEA